VFIFSDPDNKALENLILAFPVPQIENKFAMNAIENTLLSNPWRSESDNTTAVGWSILRFEENGGLLAQFTSGPVYYAFQTVESGPAIIFNILADATRTGLYPGEKFCFG